MKESRAGVPQVSVLRPVLLLLFTCGVPKTINSKRATFAGDTTLLATGDSTNEPTIRLQRALNEVSTNSISLSNLD